MRYIALYSEYSYFKVVSSDWPLKTQVVKLDLIVIGE